MNHISHFQSDFQTYTQKPLRVKPLEISSTADAFSSGSDEVHLVADEFGQAEELGFESSNSNRCCTAGQLSSGSLS